MGFLAFNKKEKNSTIDDLDIPPPPPPEGLDLDSSQGSSDLSFQDNASPPPMPQQPPAPEFPPPPSFQPPMQEPKPVFAPPEQKEQHESAPEPVQEQPHTEPITRPAPTSQVFIEVVQYKKLLKDFSTVKKSLKECDDEISQLMGDLGDEEKTFTKLHSTLTEVEQKLVQLEDGIFTQ